MLRFVASKNSDSYIPADTVITFDRKEVDNSNNFDMANGTFIAPVDGSYMFMFSASIRKPAPSKHGDSTVVEVYVNGGYAKDFHSDADPLWWRQMTFFWSTPLKKGDKLWLMNKFDQTLLIDGTNPLTFMGYLVQ